MFLISFYRLATSIRDQMTDFPGFLLAIKDPTNLNKSNRFRNPFDVPRGCLLDQVKYISLRLKCQGKTFFLFQLVRMRSNFLQPSLSSTKLIDNDTMHSLPIGQMGNYQDYLKKMPVPLREIESQPVRQHMFGETVAKTLERDQLDC